MLHGYFIGIIFHATFQDFLLVKIELQHVFLDGADSKISIDCSYHLYIIFVVLDEILDEHQREGFIIRN